jgi:hypothetical protein
VRCDRSPLLSSGSSATTIGNAAPCGEYITGTEIFVGVSSTIPYISENSEIQRLATVTTANMDATSLVSMDAAKALLVYTTSAGALRAFGAADTQCLAVADDGFGLGTAYVVYRTPTPGEIKLIHTNGTSVLATTTITGAGTVERVAVACAPSGGSICVAWADTAGAGAYESKVFTLTGGVFTDTTLDATLAVPDGVTPYITLGYVEGNQVLACMSTEPPLSA